jgi:hypothetical protein
MYYNTEMHIAHITIFTILLSIVCQKRGKRGAYCVSWEHSKTNSLHSVAKSENELLPSQRVFLRIFFKNFTTNVGRGGGGEK